jgi:uncharacterized repeat protein (TIGR03803 family)
VACSYLLSESQRDFDPEPRVASLRATLGDLVLLSNTLYGTAFYGGSSGKGTVFAIQTDGTGFTNLHSFNGRDWF